MSAVYSNFKTFWYWYQLFDFIIISLSNCIAKHFEWCQLFAYISKRFYINFIIISPSNYIAKYFEWCQLFVYISKRFVSYLFTFQNVLSAVCLHFKTFFYFIIKTKLLQKSLNSKPYDHELVNSWSKILQLLLLL